MSLISNTCLEAYALFCAVGERYIELVIEQQHLLGDENDTVAEGFENRAETTHVHLNELPQIAVPSIEPITVSAEPALATTQPLANQPPALPETASQEAANSSSQQKKSKRKRKRKSVTPAAVRSVPLAERKRVKVDEEIFGSRISCPIVNCGHHFLHISGLQDHMTKEHQLSCDLSEIAVDFLSSRVEPNGSCYTGLS